MFLRIQEYSVLVKDWVPHYQAIYYSDPQRLKVFMRNKVEGDITTTEMRKMRNR